jgi:hypothetical protein
MEIEDFRVFVEQATNITTRDPASASTEVWYEEQKVSVCGRA